MTEEKARENWWHTASIVASIAGLFSKEKVSARDFHPMENDDEKENIVPVEMLREFFP